MIFWNTFKECHILPSFNYNLRAILTLSESTYIYLCELTFS